MSDPLRDALKDMCDKAERREIQRCAEGSAPIPARVGVDTLRYLLSSYPEAALPHLLTEVKSMCETATALGLALGRKQALVDAEAAILAFDYDRLASVGLVADVQTVHTALAKIVRDMASQPLQPVSNGLTASSRHPDTPEDTKPPQEAL